MAKRQKTQKMPLEICERRGSNLWGVFFFALLVFIDQLTKMLAEVYFSAEGAPTSVDVIGQYVQLCLHYNKGIAFSWLNSADVWLKVAVVIVTAVMMLVLTVVYFRTDEKRSCMRAALVLIVAGGVGNLIDRLYFQMWLPETAFGVRDMVDLSGIRFEFLNGFNFGICNFADFFIVAGAIVLILAILFFDKDAIFPVGKYRAMAKAAEAQEQQKEESKKE